MKPVAQTIQAPRRGPWLRLRQAIRARGWGWLALQVAVTALTLWIIWVLGTGILRWVLWSAQWDVVTANLRLFAMGTYTPALAWRPALALALVAGLVGFTAPVWGSIVRDMARALAVALLALLAIPLTAPAFAALGSLELAGLAAAFAAGEMDVGPGAGESRRRPAGGPGARGPAARPHAGSAPPGAGLATGLAGLAAGRDAAATRLRAHDSRYRRTAGAGCC